MNKDNKTDIKTYWPLVKLKEWDKNPKKLDHDDFTRLKNQILELGQYKPLIITADGTVLGGNMRLKAYRELNFQEAWVSIVEADTEAKKIKYALSDNDQVGYYDQQALAELIMPYKAEIELEIYHIDSGESENLKEILDKFAPSGFDEKDRLDELNNDREVTCPECGAKFVPAEVTAKSVKA